MSTGSKFNHGFGEWYAAQGDDWFDRTRDEIARSAYRAGKGSASQGLDERKRHALWNVIEAYANANATIAFNLTNQREGLDHDRSDRNLRLTAAEKRAAIEALLDEF